MWTPDSQSLFLVTAKPFSSWQDLLDTATEAERAYILKNAEQIKALIVASKGDMDVLSKSMDERSDKGKLSAVMTYLALHDEAELKPLLGKYFKSLLIVLTWSAKKYEIRKSVLTEGRQAIPKVLVVSLDSIEALRISPDGKYLSYLCARETVEDVLDLWVLNLESGEKYLVAEQTGASTDWTADSGSLVYFQAFSGKENDMSPAYGALLKKRIRNCDGTPASKGEKKTESSPEDAKKQVGSEESVEAAKKQEAPKVLATLSVNNSFRLRCLNDDSVMVSCGEARLPARTDDPYEDNIFLIKKSGPIVPLLSTSDRKGIGDTVSYFELNPSQTRTLVARKDGAVFIYDCKTGKLTAIALPKGFRDMKENKVMPCWKNDDQVMFMADAGKDETHVKPAVLLWSADKETVETFNTGLTEKLLENLQK